MPEIRTLSYKNSTIAVQVFGHGSRSLLAFHGFGEAGSSFLALSPSLASTYTVYAPDFPWHGQTEWREPEHFSTDHLREIVELLLKTYDIQQFDVMGFSMGGKCAMYVTKFYPAQISTLWLLASDGIRTNKIYNVAVYPKWGRTLFKTTIQNPGWFFAMVKVASVLRLISPWLKKFTINHMDTLEKRKRLYHTWISMSTFNPDISKVKQVIRQHKITTLLIFGKRDEVIPPNVGRYFAADLPTAHFQEIERGHYFIDARLNPVIETSLPYIVQGNV